MPFFHRKSEEEKQLEQEEKQRRDQEQAVRQESLAALERGGIPLQAQRRLDELRLGGSSFFTSDLTVNEFLLARQSGFQPISQVMGSSIYHVGWQYMPGQYSYYGSPYGSSHELDVVTKAFNNARNRALGRLEEEARRVGADAVIGVHVTQAEYDWGTDLIEFNSVGTAVRIKDAQPAKHPALTNLSGQDFWKLAASGYWPLGVVAASTVFYVVAGWQNQMANSYWGRWANQELQDFTRGLYQARHTAMGHVWSQAQRLGAAGVVGTEIEQSEDEYEVELGNDQKRTDMIFTFHAMGTAIGEAQREGQRPPIYAGVELRP